MAEKSLADFSSDFVDAWELALKGKLTLKFETKAQATNFRHRMYGFRSLLRKALAPAPSPYDGIELSIEAEGERWNITTRLSKWREQIRALKAQEGV